MIGACLRLQFRHLFCYASTVTLHIRYTVMVLQFILETSLLCFCYFETFNAFYIDTSNRCRTCLAITISFFISLLANEKIVSHGVICLLKSADALWCHDDSPSNGGASQPFHWSILVVGSRELVFMIGLYNKNQVSENNLEFLSSNSIYSLGS